MKKSNYKIIEVNDDFVIIRDIGPWNEYLSVTNDAENVVKDLANLLADGRRLAYYDSENCLDEILITEDKNSNIIFNGFKHLKLFCQVEQ
jgi:hypothetical protein